MCLEAKPKGYVAGTLPAYQTRAATDRGDGGGDSREGGSRGGAGDGDGARDDGATRCMDAADEGPPRPSRSGCLLRLSGATDNRSAACQTTLPLPPPPLRRPLPPPSHRLQPPHAPPRRLFFRLPRSRRALPLCRPHQQDGQWRHMCHPASDNDLRAREAAGGEGPLRERPPLPAASWRAGDHQALGGGLRGSLHPAPSSARARGVKKKI